MGKRPKKGGAGPSLSPDNSPSSPVLPWPADYWTKAQRWIARLGYAALVLLSVASAFILASRGNLGLLLIAFVIVFGIFVCILGLQKLATSRERYWAWTGRVLITITVAAVVATFITTLVYLVSGQPAIMDRFFGEPFKVPAPAGVTVSPGVTDAGDAPPVPGGGLLVAAAFAADAIDRTNSITVRWDSAIGSGQRMLVSVRKKGEVGDFPPPQQTVPAEQGHAIIDHLTPGTTYEIRLQIERSGRYSDAVVEAVSTDAVRMRYGKYSSFEAYYTGALDSKGTPDAELGEYFYASPKASWLYRGGIRAGEPHGDGELTASPENCGRFCGSRCTGSFSNGQIDRAKCTLNLPFLEVPDEGSRRISYGGGSTYEGQVAGVSTQNLTQIGPFAAAFHGLGTLFARDPEYEDRYEGRWTAGGLSEGKVFSGGQILRDTTNGQVTISEMPCLLSITPQTNANAIGGRGAIVTCFSVSLGEFRAGITPVNGLSVEVNAEANHLEGSLFKAGIRERFMRTSARDAEQCLSAEDLSLQPVLDAVKEPAWSLDCHREGAIPVCDLAAKAIGFTVTVSKRDEDIPSVFVHNGMTGNIPQQSIVGIDGRAMSLPAPQAQDHATAYRVLAEMCSGNTLLNVATDAKATLDDFCPRLAIAFARILGC